MATVQPQSGRDRLIAVMRRAGVDVNERITTDMLLGQAAETITQLARAFNDLGLQLDYANVNMQAFARELEQYKANAQK